MLARFGGGDAKFEHYLGGVGVFGEGIEDVEAEGGLCKSVWQLNGGIRKPQNGVCLHEGRTFNLSKEE